MHGPSPAAATLIVTPTLDERENLPELVERTLSALPTGDLLVVDDASPDGTADLCADLARQTPRLHLLRRTGPRGLGHAYRAGFAFGIERGYDVIGTMDGDLSHAPEDLPRLLAELARGADIVIGSRYIHGGGTVDRHPGRVLVSRSANRFSALLLRMPVHDVTSGFRLYLASLLRRVRLAEIRSTGYSFLVELLYRSHRRGAAIAEVPILFTERRRGRSKLRPREIYRGAATLVGLRLRPPSVG